MAGWFSHRKHFGPPTGYDWAKLCCYNMVNCSTGANLKSDRNICQETLFPLHSAEDKTVANRYSAFLAIKPSVCLKFLNSWDDMDCTVMQHKGAVLV